MALTRRNRIVSFLLSMCVLIGMLPLSSAAAEVTEITMVIYYMPENGGYLRLNKTNGMLTGGINIDGPVTIPEKIEGYDVLSIGDNAFKNQDKMTSVTFPDGVTDIGSSVFESCDMLSSVTFGEGILSIGSAAFKDCVKLEEIVLPPALAELGDSAFEGCAALKEVIIPETLEILPAYAFSGCTSFTPIILPEGLKSIKTGALKDCTSLKRIVLPSSLEELGENVFEGCTELVDIIIEDGLTRLGNYSFTGAENLKRIQIPPSVISIAGEAFSGLSDFTIYAAAATYAQVFAAANNIPCVYGPIPEEPDPGDETPFLDIKGHWAEEDIKWAYINGLVNGKQADIFAPNDNMDRGMFATVLYRLEGQPSASPSEVFTDIRPNSFYEIPVGWANASGIINGATETLFKPADNLSRQALAVMLYRYAAYKGEDTSAQSDLSVFSDSNQISAYAQDAMSWAVAVRVIEGTNDNRLKPLEHATRAEVCAMLHRYTRIGL